MRPSYRRRGFGATDTVVTNPSIVSEYTAMMSKLGIPGQGTPATIAAEPICNGLTINDVGYGACIQTCQYDGSLVGCPPVAGVVQSGESVGTMLAQEAAYAPNPLTGPGGATGQSTAPPPAATSASSPAVVQSNAPNSTSVIPASLASLFSSASSSPGGCFALFGDQNSCIGPIGSTTLMVLGGGLLAWFLLFGGKR